MTFKRTISAALLVLIVALLASCDDSVATGYHWRRPSGAQTVVYYSITPGAEEFTGVMRTAAAQWSANSRVEAKVVTTCPAGANCVTVHKSTAYSSCGYTTVPGSGDRTIKTAAIRFNTNACRPNVYLACHEMGHTLGLTHNKYTPGQAPCFNGAPSTRDQSLVADAHKSIG